MPSPYDRMNFGSFGGAGANGRQLSTSYGTAPDMNASESLLTPDNATMAGTMISPGMGTVIGAGIGAVGSYLNAREQREVDERRMALEAEMKRRSDTLSALQNTNREYDTAFQNIMGAASQSLFRK